MFKRSLVLLLFMLALQPRDASAQLLSSLLGSSTSTSSSWTSPKTDEVVERAVQAGKSSRVIVRYQPQYRTLVNYWLQTKGAKYHAEIRGMNVVAVDLSAAAVKFVATLSAVINISADSTVGIPGPGLAAENPYYMSPDYDGQGLRKTLGLVPADTGRNVGVAIIDSGIAPTADVAGRITAFYDFTITGAAVAAAPSDGYGHGTHIAGLIAGSGANSNGKYVGMATAARLIGLKVLDAQGSGFTSDVIAAIDFATNNRAALGIDVINLSLGHPIFEPAANDPMVQAVERAVDAGIVVVVSAGNVGMDKKTNKVGYAGITSPGNAPSALTVGSLRHKGTPSRQDDEISMFSSRGPSWYDGLIKPDVLAPGQALIATANLTSTLGKNQDVQVDKPGYIKLSGTSMATGIASGVVADMIDANRRDEGAASVLTPNTIKAILQYTAIPLSDDDPATPKELEQGTGSINAAGAITLVRAIDPAVPVGSPWLEFGVDTFSNLAGDVLGWGQHIVWGDHVVWGDSILSNQNAWANHVVWGDSTADHVVWGDSLNLLDHIVWGDSVLDHIVWGDSTDHVVWGDSLLDHIVWGDSLLGILGL